VGNIPKGWTESLPSFIESEGMERMLNV